MLFKTTKLPQEVIINQTQLGTLKATIMSSLARYAYQCNSGMSAMSVSNYFLRGFKSCSMRFHPCGTIMRLRTCARYIIGPRREPIMTILLNGHSINNF